MRRKHSFISFIFAFVLAVSLGLGTAHLLITATSGFFSVATEKSLAWTKLAVAEVRQIELPSFKLPKFEWPSFSSYGEYQSAAVSLVVALPPPKTRYIEAERLEVPASGKFITADLKEMAVTLYQDGREIKTMPILTIGKSGTAWETPRGSYAIETRERTHFSTIGSVYMPYSMQFNGNYFIHGETYYPGGAPVSATFSGGCIKLKTVDAKAIYDFAPIGTPVFVSGGETADSTAVRPNLALPDIPVEAAYLIADLRTGEVLAERQAVEEKGIGTLSRLMTALVTLDSINFFRETAVRTNGASLPAATILFPGEKIQIKELLYPLIFGDQGAAAETIAGMIGREEFVKRMNTRASSVSLKNTEFTDPAGKLTGNNSSAEDLFRLARHLYFFKQYLWELSAKPEVRSGVHRWVNQNGLSGMSGFAGGITGQTETGEGGILIQKNNGRILILVALDSKNAVGDLKTLSDYVKQNVVSVRAEGSPVSAEGTTTMSFVGDIMLDRGVEQAVKAKGGGDFSWAFADLTKLKADIVFGNLEGSVSDRGNDLGNAYSFRHDPAVIPALKKAGFSVLSVANNHAGDWSAEAFTDSLSRLSGAGFGLAGGGTNFSAAGEPYIISRNGVKFGWLGFSDVGPNWLAAGSTTAGILLASDPRAPELIAAAAKKCDVLLVSYHFGEEYAKAPNWRQKQLAKMAIDNGAKVVIGHHPHVIQPIEKYKDGVIMYSLGNFIFDQYFSTSTMNGLAVKLTFNGKNISKIEKFTAHTDWNFRVRVE
ncbi:MAG: CapA family protein [Candidatus Vogelbacteria bacterium]|nr:CapA family protein [Candidatus Vogelbacteria bacterium]